jgi:hypothetical protein
MSVDVGLEWNGKVPAVKLNVDAETSHWQKQNKENRIDRIKLHKKENRIGRMKLDVIH